MRKLFPGYYRPEVNELSHKFKECIFCFDTNVLLNLYRYTPESRDNLFKVLQALNNRIWLPHQAGLEYQRNRAKELLGQIGQCSILEGMIDTTIDKVEQLRRSNLFTVNTLIEPIKKDLTAIKVKLQKKKEKKPDLMMGDPVFDAVTELFDGKVGNPYTAEEYKDIYKKGKERYESKIPPGYMDMEKKNPNDTDQFGDLVLWFQILDFAKGKAVPIILITDDAKEDWWREVGGEKLGPRPELVDEFLAVTGGNKWFYMYSTEQFLKYAKEYLDAEVTPQVISEAEGIEKQDAVQEKIRMTELDFQASHFRNDLAAVEAIAQARVLDKRDIAAHILQGPSAEEINRIRAMMQGPSTEEMGRGYARATRHTTEKIEKEKKARKVKREEKSEK